MINTLLVLATCFMSTTNLTKSRNRHCSIEKSSSPYFQKSCALLSFFGFELITINYVD